MLIGLVAGLFLAFSGAFGSGFAPLWLRLVYWVPLIILGGFWSHLSSFLLDRWFDIDARPWLGTLLLSLIMSVPITLMVWITTRLMFQQRLPEISDLSQFFVPVLVITLPLCAINVFLGKAQPLETHAVPETVTASPVRFLDRLPPRLRGGDLLAVQAEDHYLRLHTDRGSDLILMRLSDAVSELDGLEGAQTHRSWWVAKSAVVKVARGDGRATLTLSNGLDVPVSRRYARTLRTDGWW